MTNSEQHILFPQGTNLPQGRFSSYTDFYEGIWLITVVTQEKAKNQDDVRAYFPSCWARKVDTEFLREIFLPAINFQGDMNLIAERGYSSWHNAATAIKKYQAFLRKEKAKKARNNKKARKRLKQRNRIKRKNK